MNPNSTIGNTRERQATGDLRWLAVIVFCTMIAGTLALWHINNSESTALYKRQSSDAVQFARNHISTRLKQLGANLNRKSSRWLTGAEHNEHVWRVDAANLVRDFPDIKAIEYIDSSFHIRRIEPMTGNEKALGLDITFEGRRKAAVEKVISKTDPTISQTIDLVQGGKGFLVYGPIREKGKVTGIVAAVCLVDKVMGQLPSTFMKNYEVELTDNGKPVYSTFDSNRHIQESAEASLEAEFGVPWKITIRPTEYRLSSRQGWFNDLLLVTGLALSILSSIAILLLGSARQSAARERKASGDVRRYAEQLERNEKQLETIYAMSPIGEAIVGIDGKWRKVNQALLEVVGYSEEELLTMDFQSLTHPDDVQADQEGARGLADGSIHVYETEKRYIHKQGHTVWVRLSASLVQTADDAFFTSRIQDITDRKNQERLIAEYAEMLETQKDELIAANQRLEEFSSTDALTGLSNRRSFTDRLATLFSLRGRYEMKVAVIMIDIDHFKSINDTHGHLVGDEVLIQMGQILKDSAREADMAARYGGEEFIILCPQTKGEDAAILAERIRAKIEAHSFDHGKVTASLGVAEVTDIHSATHELLAAADQALYSSKENGRNRVTVAAALDQAA